MKPLKFLKMRQGKNNCNKILLDELDLLRFLFGDLFPIIKNSCGKPINNWGGKNNKAAKNISIEEIVKIEEAVSKQKSATKKDDGAGSGNGKIEAAAGNEGLKNAFFL